MRHKTKQFGSIKRSITLPVELDKFIQEKAKKTAKARGNQSPNYSASLVDVIIGARTIENNKLEVAK